MSSILPINVSDLLSRQGVESSRVELKASWSEPTSFQVLKSICAFANDFQNLNGGYIVIGVAEENGCAVLPPKGIQPQQIDSIQKWIRGHCKTIDPVFHPVISPETFEDKMILVIWVPGSDNRPHRAPSGERADKKYWIRLGSETCDATVNGVLQDLLNLTARVPFDDRKALIARIDDLREAKVREFLRDIRSGLIDEESTKELYRKLRISVPVNGHDAPKNVGLLFFSEDADEWFPGAKIEVVHFAEDASGNILEEKTFRGGIHEQTRQALNYLEGFSSLYTEKQNTFEAKGFVNYPLPALREALVNAVYHRSYESHEPTKIYLYNDKIEIISYPGPVPGIHAEHLQQLTPIPPVPARNRRIGEFLKELRLAEGRGTGLPKLFRVMRENGSPVPQFDFDEQRTYFKVTLPAHPEYVAISALRDVARLIALGREQEAFKRIDDSWQKMPDSPLLTAEMLRILVEQGKVSKAEAIYVEYNSKIHSSHVTKSFIETLINKNQQEAARKYINDLPNSLSGPLALESAILARRMHKEKSAHKFFENAGDLILQDPRYLLEYAQCKMSIANSLYQGRKSVKYNRAAYLRFLHEALSLLERLISMDTDRVRLAWTWREIARAKKWLKFPIQDINNAYEKAVEYGPDVDQIVEEQNRWMQQRSGNDLM